MMVDLSFLRSAVRNGPRLRPSSEAEHYSLRRGIERQTRAESIGRGRQRALSCASGAAARAGPDESCGAIGEGALDATAGGTFGDQPSWKNHAPALIEKIGR